MTPAFLAVWNTNDSNSHRVTVNQALLVALGQGFTSAAQRFCATQHGGGGWQSCGVYLRVFACQKVWTPCGNSLKLVQR